MSADNPHIGSSFESWLEAEGIAEEVKAAAAKSIIAEQIASEMKRQKISKVRMAELMQTSRAQVDRLLDPSLRRWGQRSPRRRLILGRSVGCTSESDLTRRFCVEVFS